MKESRSVHGDDCERGRLEQAVRGEGGSGREKGREGQTWLPRGGRQAWVNHRQDSHINNTVQKSLE